jgi:PEP-CTERM motif
MKTMTVFLLAIGAAARFADSCSAQLFRDEMINAAGWGINKGADTDSAATFGYDYSADGIPEAPHSQSGDAATSGLKLEANNGDAIQAAALLTVYPLGQSFSGDTHLRFDAWMNYDAVEANEGTANGTTEFLGGGIGYDNIGADWGAGAQSVASGDRGAVDDWRVFDPSFVAAADMVAGDRNGSNAYYADFLPAVPTPAAQNQIGAIPPQLSMAGSPGFQWITWDIRVTGDIVRVAIEKLNGDQLPIATWDRTVRGTTTDGNISILYGDVFSSITPRPDLTFGVVDNVVVTVPEPSTALLLCIGALGVAALRRRHGTR